jgi:hypothetical protein
MNNLQSGVTSSQLSPQSFKNSSQARKVQPNIGNPELQQSNVGSNSLNSLSVQGSLKVSNQPPNQVLGESTTASVTPLPGAGNTTSTNYVSQALVLTLVSGILAAYFYRRFNALSTAEAG